jgi:RNA polymerase sigma factor (sigma-70 family)
LYKAAFLVLKPDKSDVCTINKQRSSVLAAVISDTEEKDLERMFAEARRYPLLTSEQEQSIDRDKWTAIAKLQQVLLEDPTSRAFLCIWAANCMTPLPKIELFNLRGQHFLLRRDLAALLPGGEAAESMSSFRLLLHDNTPATDANEALEALSLPASLVVGMTELIMRNADDRPLSGVADALEAWSRHWDIANRFPEGINIAQPTRERCLALLKKYTCARDLLMLHNLRLVYSIAGRYRGRGMAFLDLVQEGTLGLLRAAEKFQHQRGYRFSTYCFNWISQAVRRMVSENSGIIRYPGHVNEQLGKLYGQRAAEVARTGVTPSDTQLASALGLTTQKTRDLLQLRNLGISLASPQFDDSDTATLADTLPASPFDQPMIKAEHASLKRCLLSEIKRLEPAEQQVVINRWGLHHGPALSRTEIADKMAVSREWVRQLERSALNKLGQNAAVRSAYTNHEEVSSQ